MVGENNRDIFFTLNIGLTCGTLI